MTHLYAQVLLIITLPFRPNLPQVAEYIAECARILDKSGLKYQVRVLSTPSVGLFG